MFGIKNLKQNIQLAPYTTYKIGGTADYFLKVHSKDELIEAVRAARNTYIPFFILGTGANILIGDNGFRGLVIVNKADNFSFEGNLLRAESCATIASLIEASAGRGLSGLEHYAGIPSSVGGALWQNLHFLSPDRTRTIFIEEIFNGATLLDEKEKVFNADRDFFEFGYDTNILHRRSLVVLEAVFALTPKSKDDIYKQIEANLLWRNEKQPQLAEYPSCGSVFKKIKDIGAGRLIERAGLKGYQIGGAQISEKHANYIVNCKLAKASDVRALITHIQKIVHEHSGYMLEPEISFVGEF